MQEHRSPRPSREILTNDRSRLSEPSPSEITDIIPFNEFGSLDEVEFRHSGAFDTEARVAQAPELDDLHESDNLTPLRLVKPAAGKWQHTRHTRRPGRAEIPVGTPVSRAQHRKATATRGVVRGRLLITAMAAGATAAAANSALSYPDTQSSPTVLAADEPAMGTPAVAISTGMQVITVTPPINAAVASEELAKGIAFAEERAQREAKLQRPLYALPTLGIPTSGYGERWGALHTGIDIANSMGTPIYAAADGVVIDAGPVSGFGLWVRLHHSDGTVTLYGHINSTTVEVGDRVMAGDQIATMGNRGFSTGPHLHFEVQLSDATRVDPASWLAQRGLGIGDISE